MDKPKIFRTPMLAALSLVAVGFIVLTVMVPQYLQNTRKYTAPGVTHYTQAPVASQQEQDAASPAEDKGTVTPPVMKQTLPPQKSTGQETVTQPAPAPAQIPTDQLKKKEAARQREKLNESSMAKYDSPAVSSDSMSATQGSAAPQSLRAESSSMMEGASESYAVAPPMAKGMSPAPPAPHSVMQSRVQGIRQPQESMLYDRYDGYAPPQDGGRFEQAPRNSVKRVAEEPVSTFSVDVDTVSYAFVRRMLNQGSRPSPEMVRVEEMINYFDYDYEVPRDVVRPFKPTIAVYPTPWNPATMLLHVGIKGYEPQQREKPRSNLVFLIDVSGSMDGPDRLPLLQSSLRMLVEELSPRDTVGIVVYAGSARVVLNTTSVKDKSRIINAIDSLHAGGSTAGGEGISLAYAMARESFDKEAVNRIMLATDGDFNVGINDPGDLKSYIAKQRESGIYLSVLGFGQGNYRDDTMQSLAQSGNGNAAYIDTLAEAHKVLVQEASSTLIPIAKDVKIQVEFNPARVADYRLIGYETRQLRREDFNNDAVDAGEVGAGHTVTALYEFTPVTANNTAVDKLRYGQEESSTVQPASKEKASDEYAFVKIRYKRPHEEESRLITEPVTQGKSYASIKKAPADMRFAAAVAAFGQMLQGSPWMRGYTYADVLELAASGTGADPYGHRNEFSMLVRIAQSLR